MTWSAACWRTRSPRGDRSPPISRLGVAPAVAAAPRGIEAGALGGRRASWPGRSRRRLGSPSATEGAADSSGGSPIRRCPSHLSGSGSRGPRREADRGLSANAASRPGRTSARPLRNDGSPADEYRREADEEVGPPASEGRDPKRPEGPNVARFPDRKSAPCVSCPNPRESAKR